MNNDIIESKSIGIGKFSGLIVAFLIVSGVFLIPTLPNWLALIALYPFITSVIDIFLLFRQ